MISINLFKSDGGQVDIVVNGSIKESYDLKDDQVIKLNYNDGHNTLKIQDGKASVTDADCPDGLCIEQKTISKQGETIVCLPHKVVIKVNGGDDPQVDGVVK